MIEHRGNPPVFRWNGKAIAMLPCGHFCSDLPVSDNSQCCECRGLSPDNRCELWREAHAD